MQRTASRSKWKDVLGFDDGSSQVAPPTYRYTSSTLSPISPYPTFPRSLSLTYHKNQNDLLIKPHLPAPQYGELDKIRKAPRIRTLFYINIHDDASPEVPTSRPEIVFHSGRSASTRIIAFAKFHSVTQSADITLCPRNEETKSRPGTSPQDSIFSKPGLVLGKDDSERPRFKIMKLETKGGFLKGERSVFSCGGERIFDDFGGSERKREKFEWRVLERRKAGKDGWRLVRVKTKEVVAVWEENEGYGGGSLGHFTFLGEEERFGEEFNVLAVITLLSVVERERREGLSRTLGILHDRCGLSGLLK